MTFAPGTIPEDKVRPLRRAEYDRLARLGAFGGESVELMYGRLVRMSPQGERHAFSITRLTKLLARGLGDRGDLRVQLPFAASDISEPEPDIAVVSPGDYLDEHPKSALLIVEVADSSLDEDRRIKGPLYAAAGVPEYWIVDLSSAVVEVHRTPGASGYASVTRYGREATLAVPGVGLFVPVREIIPGR